MRNLAKLFTRHYGAHPLHLLTMLAGFAMLGYVLVIVKPVTLWNPGVWWQSIVVWFAAAVIGHDLVLFPIYALADSALNSALSGLARSRPHAPEVPVRNYIRVPAFGAGLTLLVFLPGIVEQGADTYQAATGGSQQPFLGRWLLLIAAMFTGSALAYGARLFRVHRRSRRSQATPR